MHVPVISQWLGPKLRSLQTRMRDRHGLRKRVIDDERALALAQPPERVIAIEIGRQNFDVMSMNIRANDMENISPPIHCGIWSSNGSMQADFTYANWYHLAAPDEHADLGGHQTVPTRTLDDIIDGHNLEIVDFLNLQLNGAESESLLGLERRFNDVKILRIAAYYTRDGESQDENIRTFLRGRDCTILSKPGSQSIIAATRRFADQFDRKRRREKGAAQQPATT